MTWFRCWEQDHSPRRPHTRSLLREQVTDSSVVADDDDDDDDDDSDSND